MSILKDITDGKVDISRTGFVQLVDMILNTFKNDKRFRCIYLMNVDGTLKKITGYTTENQEANQNESISMKPEDLEAGSIVFGEIELDSGIQNIFVPVYLRMKPVMYVYAQVKPDNDCIALLSEAALAIQSIASQKNFEESLSVSYRLMEEVLDDIPTGVAVLDRGGQNILLINKEAEKSRAIQNAMGTALLRYSKTGDKVIVDVNEKESGLWFDIYFTSVTWIDDNPVLMCSAIDTTQKVLNRKRIEYQANNDYLTGLFNRMKCEKDLKEIVDDAVKNNTKGSVLFIDLDNFKHINDGLGHQYGDLLLQEIAKMLSGISQISDNCYRLGGDEFVVIIKPEFYAETDEIADLILKRFNIPWKLIETEYRCTMSMGIAVFPDEGADITTLVKKADTAMYEAKNSGKNRYFHFKDLS